MEMEFSMIKTVLFTMESGMKIRDTVKVKCYSRTVQYMKGNGCQIKCMARESLSPATVIDTREILTMV
jgi:hypothetical protein